MGSETREQSKISKSLSTFNSATKKGGKMESSSSSPETPEILRDVSHQENLEEQCQELLKTSENREEKPKKRNDTPWPKDTESKIQSLTGLSGSLIKSEDGKIGSDDVVF